MGISGSIDSSAPTNIASSGSCDTELGGRILKVNHVGENGAVHIYAGQILIARVTAPYHRCGAVRVQVARREAPGDLPGRATTSGKALVSQLCALRGRGLRAGHRDGSIWSKRDHGDDGGGGAGRAWTSEEPARDIGRPRQRRRRRHREDRHGRATASRRMTHPPLSCVTVDCGGTCSRPSWRRARRRSYGWGCGCKG